MKSTKKTVKAKKTETAETKPEQKSEAKYSVIITVNGNRWEGSGNDVEKIVRSFSAPDFIKSKVVITVSDGGRVKEQVFAVPVARRIFGGARGPMDLFTSRLIKFLG